MIFFKGLEKRSDQKRINHKEENQLFTWKGLAEHSGDDSMLHSNVLFDYKVHIVFKFTFLNLKCSRDEDIHLIYSFFESSTDGLEYDL
jgi:hypothetical protein